MMLFTSLSFQGLSRFLLRCWALFQLEGLHPSRFPAPWPRSAREIPRSAGSRQETEIRQLFKKARETQAYFYAGFLSRRGRLFRKRNSRVEYALFLKPTGIFLYLSAGLKLSYETFSFSVKHNPRRPKYQYPKS